MAKKTRNKAKAKSIKLFSNKAMSKVTLNDLADIAESQRLEIQLRFVAKEKLKQIPLDLSSPEEGHIGFFVLCSKLSIYTKIGADNVHHASNKATKLFGPGWTSVTQHDSGVPRHYEKYDVARFGELIRELSN